MAQPTSNVSNVDSNSNTVPLSTTSMSTDVDYYNYYDGCERILPRSGRVVAQEEGRYLPGLLSPSTTKWGGDSTTTTKNKRLRGDDDGDKTVPIKKGRGGGNDWKVGGAKTKQHSLLKFDVVPAAIVAMPAPSNSKKGNDDAGVALSSHSSLDELFSSVRNYASSGSAAAAEGVVEPPLTETDVDTTSTTRTTRLLPAAAAASQAAAAVVEASRDGDEPQPDYGYGDARPDGKGEDEDEEDDPRELARMLDEASRVAMSVGAAVAAAHTSSSNRNRSRRLQQLQQLRRYQQQHQQQLTTARGGQQQQQRYQRRNSFVIHNRNRGGRGACALASFPSASTPAFVTGTPSPDNASFAVANREATAAAAEVEQQKFMNRSASVGGGGPFGLSRFEANLVLRRLGSGSSSRRRHHPAGDDDRRNFQFGPAQQDGGGSNDDDNNNGEPM